MAGGSLADEGCSQPLAALVEQVTCYWMIWSARPSTDGGIFRPSALAVSGEPRSTWTRILKGAKPADLPVEQPTKFELIVNLKSCVPWRLLARDACNLAVFNSN